MFNNKKLYITGVGASKDLNHKNLLGSELLDQIKNHRFYIYYWLIAMVVNSIATENGINLKNINNKITEFLNNNKEHKKLLSYKFQDLIDSFLNKLLELNSESKLPSLVYHKDPDRIERKKEITDELEEQQDLQRKKIKVYIESQNFLYQKFDIGIADDSDNFWHEPIEEEFYHYTAIYYIVAFKLENYEEYYQDDDLNDYVIEKKTIQPKIFSDFISKFCDFIVNEKNNNHLYCLFFKKYSRKYLPYKSLPNINKEDIKKRLISDIFISLIAEKNDVFPNNSIDNIINFLYFQTIPNLPNIAEVKENASKLVENIIGKNSYSAESMQNYIKVIEWRIFQTKIDKWDNIIENTDFINFNYDDIIYDNFNKILNEDSKWDRNVKRYHCVKKIMDKIENSHVYGSIYGKESISLIRTQPSPDQITANFAKIKNSDEIYILGFGFDEYNLQNIGLFGNNLSQIENKTVYATNYGDLPRIRLMLEKLFAVKLYKESELQEKDGKIHSFWRSRDDATNKRGNNVFMSTKGVYRALTEDFI